MSNNVYQIITDRIIEKLKEGIIPWKKPWLNGLPINYVTRKPYRGLNLIMLSKGGEYLTFKQISELGGSLKKGAKSEIVIFYKVSKVKTEGAEEEHGSDNKGKRFYLLRYYRVFNVSDTEGIKSKIETVHNDPIEEAQKIVDGYNNSPEIKFGDSRKAYYSPIVDIINVPEINNYPVVQEYYCTLFHEMVHSTGHKHRLNRDEIVNLNYFGSEDYSKEELIAEMGASMLCGISGISNETINNSVAYISSWIKALKNDHTLIVNAGSMAQRACNYILGVEEEEIKQDE
jgi:antirestriction protein ArdC